MSTVPKSVLALFLVIVLLMGIGGYSLKWYFVQSQIDGYEIEIKKLQKKINAMKNGEGEYEEEEGEEDDEVINYEAGKFLYKQGEDLYLYNPETENKTKVVSSEGIIDFDLSDDGKVVAYTLEEEGFEGNSDIFIKNIDSGKIDRLTEKNDIACLDPVILPDNEQILYVKREYDVDAEKLSDGEVWIMDADPDSPYAEQLSVSVDFSDFSENKDCISEDEIKSRKIGVIDSSPDGEMFSFWKKDYGPECSGLAKFPYFADIEGEKIFDSSFHDQNKFEIDLNGDGDLSNRVWDVYEVFWLSNDAFIVDNRAAYPISGESIYYYDDDMNKKWAIFDTFEQSEKYRDVHINLVDIKERGDDKYIVVFSAYNQGDYFDYYVETLEFGEQIDLESLEDMKPFVKNEYGEEHLEVSQMALLSESVIVYMKNGEGGLNNLYLYNLDKDVEKLVLSEEDLVKISTPYVSIRFE